MLFYHWELSSESLPDVFISLCFWKRCSLQDMPMGGDVKHAWDLTVFLQVLWKPALPWKLTLLKTKYREEFSAVLFLVSLVAILGQLGWYIANHLAFLQSSLVFCYWNVSAAGSCQISYAASGCVRAQRGDHKKNSVLQEMILMIQQLRLAALSLHWSSSPLWC